MHNLGRHNFGRQILVCTASSTNIVILPRRRVDAVRALVHVEATDAAHKGSAERALYHSFWQTSCFGGAVASFTTAIVVAVSSSFIVRLPRRRVGTARALVHGIATAAAHKGCRK